jgi:hypothetical protein
MAAINQYDPKLFSIASLQKCTAKSVGLALNAAASVVGTIGMAMILSGVNCENNGESCLNIGVAGYDVSNFCENNLGISNNCRALVGVVTLVAAKKLSDAGNRVGNIQFNNVATATKSSKKQIKTI